MAGRFTSLVVGWWLLLLIASSAVAEAAKPTGHPILDQAAKAAVAIPLNKLPKSHQQRVSDILNKPAIYCRRAPESFPCDPAIYNWLLEHPQHGVKAWQAVGAKCVAVERKADGEFRGADASGSEVRWFLLLAENNRRIWYVEGGSRPFLFAPQLTVKAVLVMSYEEIQGPNGTPGIRQQTELFGQFDGKAATLLAKLWGTSVDAAVGNALEQVETFFSGMAWYLTEHPAWGRKVFNPTNAADKLEARQYETLAPLLEKLDSRKSK
jgi:hypothetical protein